MKLLFFGTAERQLFGAYHGPTAGVRPRGAAVLCPPWGPEYLVSHRILRRLAERLSENGYHVLRFDYYGTGDSAGRRDEGDLGSWCDDAAVAVEELRDMSGMPTVAAFGIRLGAVVGWRLALQRPDVTTVVMWDPVVNGTGYLKDLVATQAEIDRWSLTRPRKGAPRPREIDLVGFPLTPEMRASIELVAPTEFRAPTRAGIKLFFSDVMPEQDGLRAALDAAGTPFQMQTVPGQTPWREVETISAAGVPLTVLERMVEMVG